MFTDHHLRKLETEMNELKQERDEFRLLGWKKQMKIKRRGEKHELVAPYTKRFEDKVKEFRDECRKEYKILISAEKNERRKASLEEERKRWLPDDEAEAEAEAEAEKKKAE